MTNPPDGMTDPYDGATNPPDDIIRLPHHTSRKRPRMSAHDRAAQFSPFAALTGYDESITETARLTKEKLELDEYGKSALNEKLSRIQEQLSDRPEVAITYFQSDSKKAGGEYVTASGIVKKIDEYERTVVMQDLRKIPIEDIFAIEGEMFEGSEH